MRVLIVGDSPILKTGFGVVNAHAAKGFLEAGWEVGSVAGLTTTPGGEWENGIRMYYPDNRDVLGRYQFKEIVDDYKPDLVYMTADAGTATAMSVALPDIPALAYIPIEGEPLGNLDWRRIIQTIPVVTCSQYGVFVIKQDTGKEVPFVYHGVDIETFRPNGRREEIRTMLGWTDKFVITAVATNVRRKQLPRLIEAVSILRYQHHVNDIILYLHTVPFQDYWLEGHNLVEVTSMFAVYDIVLFNQDMQKRNDAIPAESYLTMDGEDRPGLVDLLNASDLGVNCSQVEGFSLTNAEMMACGLPLLTTKYAAGWEVASPAGRGIPVHDWEIHKSTTKYANVSPETLAKEILRLKRNPKDRARMSEIGLLRAQDFKWSEYESKIVQLAEESISAYKVSHPEQQGADTPEETGDEGVILPENQIKGSIQADSDIAEGTISDIDGQETTHELVAS